MYLNDGTAITTCCRPVVAWWCSCRAKSPMKSCPPPVTAVIDRLVPPSRHRGAAMSAKVLVSRCLLGHRVRYDGGASGPYDQLANGRRRPGDCAVPGSRGGLPTPRAAAEIPGGQGVEVLSGKAAGHHHRRRGRHRGLCVRRPAGAGAGANSVMASALLSSRPTARHAATG
jgi:hypothetical protein